MRLQEQIEQAARQAPASGHAPVLAPDRPMGPAADERWRLTPDPVDGALRFDPEFSLPSIAGPVTWRLFYNSIRADTLGDCGWGFYGSFPLWLTRDPVGDTVTITHEDGTIRLYNPDGQGGYVASPQNGDTLVSTTFFYTETLADSGLQYVFSKFDRAPLDYRSTPEGQWLIPTGTYDFGTGHYTSHGMIEPTGRRVTLTCNAQGLVQTVEDWGERGLVVLTYNDNDELTELWEQEGVVTRYGYDVGGLHRVTSIVDPAGYETTYTYANLKVTSRSVDGHYSTYNYDTLNQTGYVDPLGRRWTYVNQGGYPAARIDPLGNRQNYNYFQFRATQFRDELGYTINYGYDTNGYLDSVQDQLGNYTYYTHDDNGNIISVIDALGNETDLDYGANPALRHLAKVTDPLGHQTRFWYDGNGLPTCISDEAGYQTAFVWNDLALLTSVMNARGNVWTYTYDAAGNRIETLDPLGYRWTYSYDQRGRLVGEQTPLGARWTTVYDTRDLVQALVDPLGYRTTYTRNAEGRVTEVIDAAGNRWTNLYDVADQLTARIDPLGQRTSFYYDLAGRLTVIQDATGARSTLVYDAAGRQIASVDPLGNRTTFGYDAVGRVVSVLNARGYVTTYSYDAAGQLQEVINRLGYRFTVLYDAAGHPTDLLDPLGGDTFLHYDLNSGFLDYVIDPLGNLTTYSYTPTEQLESVADPRGQLWTLVYDAWDRLQASVDPLGSRVTRIYDPAGRVSALWDARGNRWTSVYDVRDLAIGSTDPLGRKATYSYDALGQLATFTDQKGQLATYSYSTRYQITGEIYSDGTRLTYGYDAVGQLATVVDGTGWHTLTYNARGDLASVQSPQHPSHGILTYGYDAVGNRTTILSWLGRQTMMYDALDRCASVAYDTGKITTWLYDGLNRPTMQFNWNGTRTTWAYDADGQVRLIRHATSANALLDFATYTYDAAGNPLTRLTNSTRATWTYDNAGQLLTERHTTNNLTDTYTYDAAGNRTQRARNQSGALTLSTYVYDAAGQLVTMLAGTARTTFVYDANGNLQSENTAPTGTTTYTWDVLDRMTGVIVPGGTRTTYAYRYDDLRASQNTGSGVQTLVWDVPGSTGFGDLFEELDSSGNLLRAYYRGADLSAQKDASGSYAFHWIDAGTAQLLSDLNQVATLTYQYGAWGEQFASSGTVTTPLSWNGDWGYYRDTSARTWVRARHLDVLRGRWFGSDPLGFNGGSNLYAYVRNCPPSWVDPTGLRINIVAQPDDPYFDFRVRMLLGRIATQGPVGNYLVSSLIRSKFTITITRLGYQYRMRSSALGIPHPEPYYDPHTEYENKQQGDWVTRNRRGGLLGHIWPDIVHARQGPGTSTTIRFSPQLSIPACEVPTSNNSSTTPEIILAHELAHAYHAALGQSEPERGDEELSASRLENAIRAEFGPRYGQRTMYIGYGRVVARPGEFAYMRRKK